jgi:pullulanase
MITSFTDRPLGALYSPEETTFVLWAPAATEVSLRLYGEPTTDDILMEEEEDDTFSVTVPGDLAGRYYTYLLKTATGEEEIVDPYAKGLALNSTAAAVIDPARTVPEGFIEHKRPHLPYREAIIYEAHIRDLTTDPRAGFVYPGRLLGLTEERQQDGTPIGTDHLVELGVTHLHLLPIQDFLSVDERKEEFNWGYDPEYYFSIEGSYIVERTDPHARARELKTLVRHLHEKGLGLVMDVVYNHTFRLQDSVYEKIAPGYFFRMKNGVYTNGSGVGNELDTEKPMVRRLIRESLMYFLEEFQVDGFRFDLWGLMDIDFTLELVRTLREANPNVLLYGEPWGGAPSALPLHQMTLKGTQRNREFALFNDDFRNAIKGGNDDSTSGYVQGSIQGRNGTLTGIAGSISFSPQLYGFTAEPWESINYHTSHDNLILYDKLKWSTQEGDLLIAERTKLAFAILLLSFGIPFFHAGTEFMRTKYMNKNCYNLPDEINRIRWEDKIRWKDVHDYVRNLIAFRKKVEVFCCLSADEIREQLVFLYSDFIIAFTLELTEGPFDSILIAHNPSSETKPLRYDTRGMELYAEEGVFYTQGIQKNVTSVAPVSSLVLVKRRKE